MHLDLEFHFAGMPRSWGAEALVDTGCDAYVVIPRATVEEACRRDSIDMPQLAVVNPPPKTASGAPFPGWATTAGVLIVGLTPWIEGAEVFVSEYNAGVIIGEALLAHIGAELVIDGRPLRFIRYAGRVRHRRNAGRQSNADERGGERSADFSNMRVPYDMPRTGIAEAVSRTLHPDRYDGPCEIPPVDMRDWGRMRVPIGALRGPGRRRR